MRRLEQRLTADLTPAQVARLQELLTKLVGTHLDARAPEALRTSTGFLVTRAHHRLHREFLAALTPLGIERGTLGTLRSLSVAGPMTQGDLGQLLDVSPATVVQPVDHLERAGMVARERNPLDRRAYLLHLRPAAALGVEQPGPHGAVYLRRQDSAVPAATTGAIWSTCCAPLSPPQPPPEAISRPQGPQAKLSDVPAPVLQRIEHLTTDQKVRGSNPFRRASGNPGRVAR